jgi:hypothetical protein
MLASRPRVNVLSGSFMCNVEMVRIVQRFGRRLKIC